MHGKVLNMQNTLQHNACPLEEENKYTEYKSEERRNVSRKKEDLKMGITMYTLLAKTRLCD